MHPKRDTSDGFGTKERPYASFDVRPMERGGIGVPGFVNLVNRLHGQREKLSGPTTGISPPARRHSRRLVHLVEGGLYRMSRMSGRRTRSRVNHCLRSRASRAALIGFGGSITARFSGGDGRGNCVFGATQLRKSSDRHVLSQPVRRSSRRDLDFRFRAPIRTFIPSDVWRGCRRQPPGRRYRRLYVQHLSDGPHPRTRARRAEYTAPLRPSGSAERPWGLKRIGTRPQSSA